MFKAIRDMAEDILDRIDDAPPVMAD